jgi:DNA-binding NtrC family response regulator
MPAAGSFSPWPTPPDVLLQRGVFTADVRYRLRRLEIRLPPLHERRAEIPIYVKHFLAACRDWTGLDGPREVAANALTVFRLGDYRGNLRDLASFVELAYVEAGAQGGERIEVRHLPPELRQPMRFVPHGDREANRTVLEHALALCGGRVSEAARLIGASRSHVYELLTQQTARMSGVSGTPAITGRRGASRTSR